MNSNYYDLILWVAEIPSVAIYALIGGLAGALGVAVGYILPIPKQVVVLVMIVISGQVTRQIIIPEFQNLAFEAGFMKGVGHFPRQIDDVTILLSAGIYDDAANKTYQITTEVKDLTVVREILLEIIGGSDDCKSVTATLPNVHVSQMIYRYETNLGTVEISLKPEHCL